ncbi:MAG: hypothetical protein BJ554DRAFT_4023, partial [Olpidium bornovanus]
QCRVEKGVEERGLARASFACEPVDKRRVSGLAFLSPVISVYSGPEDASIPLRERRTWRRHNSSFSRGKRECKLVLTNNKDVERIASSFCFLQNAARYAVQAKGLLQGNYPGVRRDERPEGGLKSLISDACLGRPAKRASTGPRFRRPQRATAIRRRTRGIFASLSSPPVLPCIFDGHLSGGATFHWLYMLPARKPTLRRRATAQTSAEIERHRKQPIKRRHFCPFALRPSHKLDFCQFVERSHFAAAATFPLRTPSNVVTLPAAANPLSGI